jgi:hypothetical protein
MMPHWLKTPHGRVTLVALAVMSTMLVLTLTLDAVLPPLPSGRVAQPLTMAYLLFLIPAVAWARRRSGLPRWSRAERFRAVRAAVPALVAAVLVGVAVFWAVDRWGLGTRSTRERPTWAFDYATLACVLVFLIVEGALAARRELRATH